MSLTEQARGGGAAALRAQQGPPNDRGPEAQARTAVRSRSC